MLPRILKILSQKERLFSWHTALFPSGRSDFTKIKVEMWRERAVHVVSGRMDKETIHFTAPLTERIDFEMDRFLDWFNTDSSMDLILKSAIAHFWFITIHPFGDGNGRIGRAIADLLLARSENNFRRFYSLSAQIQIERKDYYAILEQSQKGTVDITCWIEWFLGCLGRSIEKALSVLKNTLHKTRVWEALAKIPLNKREHKMINRMLDDFQGNLTSSKWAKMTKCSQDTAHRDILDLIDKAVLVKSAESGRSASYFFSGQFRI